MSAADPTGAEIQQDETRDYVTVPVHIDTPVRVQTLGAIFWTTRRFLIDNTAWVKIAQDNPRRSRLTITVRSQVGYIADQPGASVSDLSRGAAISSPSSIPLGHTKEVWFIGSSASASEVGVIEEYWAN